MYYTDDRKSAIEEIQKFLLVIYENGNRDIKRVSVDGIYGEETKDAVRKYQQLLGMEESGVVDKKTFDSLYMEYKEITDDLLLEEILIGEGLFPLTLGMQGDDVLLLNLYLIELSKNYKDLERVDKSTYFSGRTERSVRGLQRIFNEKETGEVDKKLFNRILLELKSLKLREEYR